jgi:hypothetical protein
VPSLSGMRAFPPNIDHSFLSCLNQSPMSSRWQTPACCHPILCFLFLSSLLPPHNTNSFLSFPSSPSTKLKSKSHSPPSSYHLFASILHLKSSFSAFSIALCCFQHAYTRYLCWNGSHGLKRYCCWPGEEDRV